MAYRNLNPDDLRAYIEDIGVSFKENYRSYILVCPRCGKEKLYIDKRSGSYICFYDAQATGFKGNRPEFALTEVSGQPIDHIQERIYEGRPAQLTEYIEEIEVEEEDDGIPIVSFPYDYYPVGDPFAARGVAYMESRGVPMHIQAQYGLRYCPPTRRVIFPIEDHGKLYGWQGRIIVPETYFSEETGEWFETPKVLSSKKIPRDRTLMFIDRLDGHEHAVLCEGPVDAIKAHLCGGNVATMGKVVTRSQLALLRSRGVKRVYLGLDPDAAEEMAQLVQEMSDMEIYKMEIPEGKDLGAMSFDEVYQSFKSAVRINNTYLFIHIKN